MSTVSQDISTLTDRYQTTVPSGVRKQLNLGKGDRIRYCTDANGRVYIEPVRAEEDDPALGSFLAFLEADIKAHPEQLQAFDGALYNRLKSLVADTAVDLDEPLSIEDE
ncbi:antitoxin PrlF [Fulvimarina manganoxydans]|uniref:Antitoxin PrlF n=1 Tax=Fulvimarina manganoxydans TaxID=937218 RepID=A0A1W2ARI5_9HYPH|nr:type II toxin-antitoxin system PrlF family antitoxin [Fulvimarina manganoxydans]SMC63194.1 antitoxin PrlF [Fulvimarina manganoxydans]